MVGRLRHLDHAADVGDGLALGDQLLCGSLLRRSRRLELADDLLGCVPGAFHGRVPGPVWPAEDSHSPWTEFQGPRHTISATVLINVSRVADLAVLPLLQSLSGLLVILLLSIGVLSVWRWTAVISLLVFRRTSFVP